MAVRVGFHRDYADIESNFGPCVRASRSASPHLSVGVPVRGALPANVIAPHSARASRYEILREKILEEGIRAGINANRRLYSRRTCPFIPAGLSLYSREAVLLFPQGCPFIPAGLAQQPRAAFSSCPACADGDGRDPCRQACGPARIVQLLRSAVARRPAAAAACKLRGSPRPGPQLEQGS